MKFMEVTILKRKFRISIIRLANPSWRPGFNMVLRGAPLVGCWWWRYGFYLDAYHKHGPAGGYRFGLLR